MLIYYLYRSRKIFNPKIFFKRINDAISNNRIEDDVSGNIRNDSKFQLMHAASTVSSYLSFLKDLDDRDNIFISLTKDLLGKQAVAKEHKPLIKQIEYPLRFLFNKDETMLSEEARKIKTSDIEIFKKKRQQ